MTSVDPALPSHSLFLQPGRIGRLRLKNRLVRAATSETMATERGEATPRLARLYSDLARGGCGLIVTGHIYVEPRGQYEPRQVGLDHDDRVHALASITDAVHRHDGVIFAELSHAGSQSLIPAIRPIAPSIIPNAIFARTPQEMSGQDILDVISAFGSAALRAKRAGFDGIHLHSGNGYLLSQFNSPATNRRTDQWGGDAERRGRFIIAAYRAVREAVGPDFPVTARLGLADAMTGGLSVDEGLNIAKRLEDAGLDAIEVTYGVMTSYRENIRPYVGVGPARAIADGLVHRVFAKRVPEAYYRAFARAAKAALRIPVILVGGIRSTEVMDDILGSGDADFLAMSRPFVREPELVERLIAGRRGPVRCVSCNLCFKHEGIDALKCWRTPAGIIEHIYKAYLRDGVARRGSS